MQICLPDCLVVNYPSHVCTGINEHVRALAGEGEFMPRTVIAACLTTLVPFIVGCASCTSADSPSKWDLEDECVALEGFDIVAYFKEGRAREGLEGIAHVHSGARYLFASETNRQAFRDDPSAFRLAYGGWCAYGVADGATFGADPESFLVDGDRVFLFFDAFFLDARRAWLERGHERLKNAADTHWTMVSGSR